MHRAIYKYERGCAGLFVEQARRYRVIYRYKGMHWFIYRYEFGGQGYVQVGTILAAQCYIGRYELGGPGVFIGMSYV